MMTKNGLCRQFTKELGKNQMKVVKQWQGLDCAPRNLLSVWWDSKGILYFELLSKIKRLMLTSNWLSATW